MIKHAKDMKRNYRKIISAACALLLAFVLLEAFCFWYYNPPRYDWDDARATDNIRAAGSFASRATEGFAFSRMDANGYNNPDVPGDAGVYVLMMGSSHTEGLNVKQDENISSRLGALLGNEEEKGCVYNIGISAHTLPRNIANFERALERFAPTGYVILETQEIKFHKTIIDRAMNDDFDRLKESPVMISEWISDRALLKTIYNQFSSLMSGTSAEEEAEALAEITADQLEQYQAALTDLFAGLRQTADAHGVTPIIYYHPHLILQQDGSVQTNSDAGCLAAFAAACRDAGVCFVDMTEPFLQEYAANRILPHGFSNTAPGTGHLNPDGCAMIAQALYEEICRMEEEA